ncbi:uncharacterized protein K444DRAFT_226750 [Hyaloscypha bicolor E]|uniref:Uncharacterized protein n=1 Tax=Hyaloscypha bicolor E TaxID=1095630 RepID=A0A2J6SKC5_9HELO|nr:uncharacterized protein K444DRAFT_226750 [Hyaloscypha bicolor E]PMD51193.1 hypothetical protein K444DRAFT_226750 [Hyaloscypha bicolor E]
MSRVSQVHGGDERGSGGSRLQGATDKWPQAETRQRPPTAAAQCPISDSALGRLDHPRHQKTLAAPPPLAAQPNQTKERLSQRAWAAEWGGVPCWSCSFLFACKSSPLASQQTLHDQGICKRIPSRLVSCFASAAF